MSRGRRYYRPIQPEDVSTPENALANLRPQLEGALSSAEYFRESDPQTARRHASYAERLTKEIAAIEAQIAPPTPTPPPLDLAALTAIAKAATQGPWMAKQGAISPGKKVVGPREASDLARGPIVLMQPIFWDKRSAANADHIAAFDPPTALALIARVEQLDGEHDEWRSEIGRLTRERDEWESNATEESARAEAAEAKLAAVREMCTELRDLPVSPDAPDYARQVLTGARSTATDVLAALDGTA